MEDNNWLKPILSPEYPFDTWRGFGPHSFRYLFIGAFLFVSLGLPVVNAFSLPLHFVAGLLAAFVLIPIGIYWTPFVLRRAWLGVMFSGKANIVLAYNLQGVKPKVRDQYNLFVKELQNKLDERSLGGKIKIFQKPEDIRFNEFTVARSQNPSRSSWINSLDLGASDEKEKPYEVHN